MKEPQLNKNHIINEVFQLVLKTMVELFVNAVSKETVISIYNAMNTEFVKFKDPILSQLKGFPSIKTSDVNGSIITDHNQFLPVRLSVRFWLRTDQLTVGCI